MAGGHRYEPVKQGEGDDIKDELQPTPRTVPVVTSWWKFLLCNLLAATAGATAMFLIARSTFANPSSGSTATSTAISAAPSASITSTSSAKLPIATSTLDQIKADAIAPNMQPGEILDCGWSVEDARAKGCVYDVMMQDWVPPPCYDEVLTEKYLAEGNYTWYGDGDGKTTIPDDVMRKGEHGAAWMATSYHKAHCVFSWMKIVRALRNNRGISQELLSYDHVMHCAHGALKESSEDKGLGVKAPTNYAKCALYDTWLQDLIPDRHDSTGR